MIFFIAQRSYIAMPNNHPLLKFNKIIRTLLLTAFVGLLIVPSTFARETEGEKVEAAFKRAKQVYHSFISSEARKAHRDQWLYCIKQFNYVYQNYPLSDQANKAVYNMARLYHRLYKELRNPEDLDRASHYYKKVFTEFSDPRLLDDALYYEGEIFLEKRDYASAMDSFQGVLMNFPDGDQVSRAKKQIREITAYLENPSDLPPLEENLNEPRNILKQVMHTALPGSIHVLIENTEPVKFTKNRLSNPDRYYLNFPNTRLDKSLLKNIEVGGEVLKRIRISQFDQDTARVVLDIESVRGLKIETVKGKSGIRVDLLLPPKKVITPVKKIRPTPPTPAVKVISVPIKPRHKMKTSKKEAPLVVIDPGHGGKDKGAKGKNGLMEKDINLDISKRVRKILQDKYKYRVLLTRESDEFIALDERGKMANSHGANLFVSVHVNAAKRKTAKGIETYYLGRGSSEQARETASRENGEVFHAVESNKDLQYILADMISTKKINDSSHAAAKVQDHLYSSMSKRYSGVKNLGVKEGPFFVLHHTNMPSILVEVGFITNAQEEERLRRSSYLNKLAASIAHGIHDYLTSPKPTI